MASRQRKLESLKFKDALTAKVTATEQLKRLQALHKELSQLDQDNVDTKSLDKVSKDLLSSTLLLGKDKGVKAYVACCLADLLRLYAPDAPYTAEQLRDIFSFFNTQLKNFSGPASPNYSEYFYLLESLANVKSAVLICDVPGSEQLITDYFRQFFTMAKPDLPKNLMANMADILSQLVEEAQTVPTDAVDIYLAQFLPKNVRSNPAAVSLAVEVGNLATDTLQRYVAQYVAETILNAVPEDGDDSSDEEQDNKRKRKGVESSVAFSSDFIGVHDLIKQVNRAIPRLLTMVIPQVEQEMQAQDDAVREYACKALGEMFSEYDALSKTTASRDKGKNADLVKMMGIHSAPVIRSDLAKNFPNTWKAWLSRGRDKVPAVRLAVVEAFKGILTAHHELGSDIYDALRLRLTDPDDKVRAAACAVFFHTDYEAAIHFCDSHLLHELAGRITDKKSSVQQEAFNSIGKLYKIAFGEIANGIPVAIERFSWIPHEILKATLLPNKELYACAESTIHEYILPLPADSSDESGWVDRLLTVMQALPDATQKALLRLTRIPDHKPTLFETYINTCEKFNGGTIDKNEDEITRQMKAVCRVVASTFPDPTKTEQDLNKFAKMNDNRLYKLLRTLMDPNSDLKTIIKTQHDVKKRLENLSATLLDTFSIFIRRSALLLINKSSIPQFIKRMQAVTEPEMVEDEEQDTQGQTLAKSSSGFAKLSKYLLASISQSYPLLLVPHLLELARIVLEETDEDLLTMSLVALGSVAKADSTSLQRDSRLLDRVYDLAVNGNPEQARSAALLIAKLPDSQTQCEELVGELTDALDVSSGERLVAHLQALKRLAKYATDAFETRRTRISKWILQSLRRSTSQTEMDMDIKPDFEDEFDWCADTSFSSDDFARIIGLRVLTNICLAHANDEDDVDQTALRTIKVFMLLLDKHGQPDNFRRGLGLAGRFRLQAAVSMLKLCRTAKYEKVVFQNFVTLALTVQDSAYQVRSKFIHKLVSYLINKKFSARNAHKFMTFLFLTAHDPDKENIMMATRAIRDKANKTPLDLRVDQIDMQIVRLIHILAHHPDFTEEVEDLKTFVTYIELFLDCVANRDSVSLLYYLAGRVKTVRDGQSEAHSKIMYTLSELAQHVISARAQSHGWPLPSHPGKVRMPSDIFRPLTSREEAIKIAKTVYLDEHTVEALGTVGRAVKTDIKKPRPVQRTSPKLKKEPKKAAEPKPRAVGGAKKRKAAEWADDSDDEEEEGSSEEEEEDVDEEDEEEGDQSKENRSKVGPNTARGTARTRRIQAKKSGVAHDGEDDEELQEDRQEDEDEKEEEEGEPVKPALRAIPSRPARGKAVSSAEIMKALSESPAGKTTPKRGGRANTSVASVKSNASSGKKRKARG